ncbi:hypothetical protein M0813_15888 [Anaeramoeba flamelloides]|uniref:Uncharacterized protein n=1 Tax=Anaeramoeba flamelloides TaxID=1746091 RepID=A0ABQ8Z2N0_9EUKA|nr:hypothetical protein M0813_15888 [Anaeramoeba flamelloides]
MKQSLDSFSLLTSEEDLDFGSYSAPQFSPFLLCSSPLNDYFSNYDDQLQLESTLPSFHVQSREHDPYSETFLQTLLPTEDFQSQKVLKEEIVNENEVDLESLETEKEKQKEKQKQKEKEKENKKKFKKIIIKKQKKKPKQLKKQIKTQTKTKRKTKPKLLKTPSKIKKLENSKAIIPTQVKIISKTQPNKRSLPATTTKPIANTKKPASCPWKKRHQRKRLNAICKMNPNLIRGYNPNFGKRKAQRIGITQVEPILEITNEAIQMIANFEKRKRSDVVRSFTGCLKRQFNQVKESNSQSLKFRRKLKK